MRLGFGIGLSYPLAGVALPPNFMSYSEDVSKFSWLTGGTGAAIPRVFSNGATLAVGARQPLPDIPGGEAGKGFTCTGFCQDPDSTDVWVGNFGGTRGSGGVTTPTSIVRLSADGSTLVSQIQTVQGIGGLQGVAFVTSGALRCLAYVSGANNNVYFMNRDGSVPRAPLVLPFVPNALAWDDARQALWAGDAANGDVWCVTLTGVMLGYADFNGGWGGPIDHICVDPSRGAAGYLWLTAGANGSPGMLLAWDIAKDQLVNRWLLDSAQAVEGLIVSGTTLKVVSDGYYHMFGGAPNSAAPYNVNEMQTYTIPAITQWRYSRVFKAGEIVGPPVAGGRQPYRMIIDRGDGNTNADFTLVTRDADASINGQVATMAWTGKSIDPAVTANMAMRLLNGAATNFTFGADYVRRSLSATFASGANNTQLGTRGTMSPDNIINVVGTALAVNLGSAAFEYAARPGA
ncbi:hypothetical protein ACVI1J_009897 [Bradyrhizobium diazoefficiens]